MIARSSSGPVRVLVVISNLEYGGAQRQVIELANQLDPARFDAHVCSLSDYTPLANLLADADRRLHVVRKTFKFDVTVVLRLARLMERLGIDIVHSFLFDAEIASRLAGRLSGIPIIVGSERNTDYHLKRRQLAAYRLTRGCVDLVIANSNAGADFNSRTLGFDRNRYRVVHNGVDVTRFRPGDGKEARVRLGIEEDERVVGIFASIKRQKNHLLFFRAAREILDRFPRARFLVVGDMLYAGMHGSDEYKVEVEKLVDELLVRDRCLFLGNRDDVELLYRACDVTVLPSLFEGTPNVLLESMACGVPVVASDVSDNAYIVPDGRAGRIVPIGDPKFLADRVCELLVDEERRREMGRAAREWVSGEFSTRALATKVGDIYLGLLETKRS